MQHAMKSTAAAVVVLLGLAACGGGGGGDGGSTTATTSSPSATGSPAGGGTADPTGSTGAAGGTGTDPGTTPSAGGTPGTPAAFSAFGPVPVVQGLLAADLGTAPPKPQVTRLAGGGALVAWATTQGLFAQRLDAAGARVGDAIAVPAATRAYAVAGLGNGEWVIAWSAATLAATSPITPVTVQLRRYGADGALVQDTTVAGSLPFISVSPGLQAAATADGGFALAWEGRPVIGQPNLVFLRRFGPAGDLRRAVDGVGTFTGEQTRPRLAALPDGSTVLAWLQADPAAGTTSIQTQSFGAAGETLGAERQLAASVGPGTAELAATGLPDGRVALAWTGHVAATPPVTPTPEVHWQILDAAGAPATAAGSATVAGVPQVDAVEVAPAASGFTLFAQSIVGFSRGTNQTLQAAPVAADGTLGTFTVLRESSVSSVSPTTGATNGPAAAGFSVGGAADGRVVFAWETGTPAGADVLAEGR